MSLINSIIVFLSPETDISFYPMFFWCYLSVVIINSAKLLIVRVHVSARKPNIIKYPVAGGIYQPQAPTNPPHNALQNPILAKVNYPNHPRVGQEIQVVGTRRHRGERCCVIALPDGSRELIPE
jgi:hypothetical protein